MPVSNTGNSGLNRFVWFVNFLLVFGVAFAVFQVSSGELTKSDKVLNKSFNFVNKTFSSLDLGSEWNRSKLEMKVHRSINDVRIAHGLDRLSYKQDLVALARYHSEDMANENYFAHDSPGGESMVDRYQKFDISGCGWKGENIYYFEEYYVDNLTEFADTVVAGWMNSKGHRENILTPEFDSEAIGVYRTGSGDKIYVTQNFCG